MALFRTASRRMEHLSARQQAISENVANANTPGYKAKDVVPFSEMVEGRQPMRMARTDPKHLAGTGSKAGVALDVRATSWDASPDGNSVILEEQMVKAAETREAYKFTLGLYRKSVGMFRAALGSK